MREELSQIIQTYLAKIKQAKTQNELGEIYLELFGKNGEITKIPKQFPQLSIEEKKIIAPLFTRTKLELEKAVEESKEKILEEGYKKLNLEKLDPKGQIKKRQGHLHPSTQFKKEIVDLFQKLGFQEIFAPHVEWDKYNFEDLNIPKDHPSRDMWDTLYVDTSRLEIDPGSMLLRTHTSNFWPRLMSKGKTPICAMSFDRCFRYEAVDARHAHTFNQFEIAIVGEKGKFISMANLKYLSDYLLKGILGKEAKSRFRPKYYPFVEPGVGIDCLCVFCHGKGCKICSGIGWFEIAGAGLIHPNVLSATGIDPKEHNGLAWGFGPDRMLMLKHSIEDIRYFLEGDLKFLQSY